MLWQVGAERGQHYPQQSISSAHQQLEKLELSTQDQALLRYCIQLTIHPAAMTRENIATLRSVDFNDREIHDIAMVVACFSFMNRLADGTGVTCLEKRKQFAITLLGEDAWNKHLTWGAEK